MKIPAHYDNFCPENNFSAQRDYFLNLIFELFR